jgi:hypothetical protein
MALLPTSVSAGTSGHLANHAQVHGKLNTGAVDVVADFGADNTGTNSASTAIQNAVTAAENAGGVPVYIPPGDYKMTTTVNITKPGMVVFGAGWESSLNIPNATNIDVFTFVPANGIRMDGVVIRDLRIDCNGANQTGGGGINAFGASYCQFEHLEIRAPWEYGIELHEDNLGGFGHHNVVRDCWIHLGALAAPVSGGKGTAIYMWSSDENLITGCTFEANGSAVSSAAHIFESAGLNNITGNMFIADPNVASVEFIKSTGSGNVISGNILDGGTNAQVEVGGNYCMITSNRFYRPIGGNDCLLVLGNNNTIVANSFCSGASNGDSRHAINAGGASGINYRWANVVETQGSWAGSIYNGSGSELVVAAG